MKTNVESSWRCNLASTKVSAGCKFVCWIRRHEPRSTVTAERSNANERRQRTTLMVGANVQSCVYSHAALGLGASLWQSSRSTPLNGTWLWLEIVGFSCTGRSMPMGALDLTWLVSVVSAWLDCAKKELAWCVVERSKMPAEISAISCFFFFSSSSESASCVYVWTSRLDYNPNALDAVWSCSVCCFAFLPPSCGSVVASTTSTRKKQTRTDSSSVLSHPVWGTACCQ